MFVLHSLQLNDGMLGDRASQVLVVVDIHFRCIRVRKLLLKDISL